MKTYELNEKIKKKFKRKYKIGLCLSGGGVRGFAHMGAFKAFEEYGIEFDMVAGTSAGSLFAMLYASRYTYEQMYNLTNDIKTSDFKRSKLAFLPSKMDSLEELIRKIAPVKNIEELPIPMCAVAVDIRSGQEHHFCKGEIAPILTGSSAFPYIFYPVKYRSMLLVDGGVKNNIPADVLKMKGCDYVITIDCNANRGLGTKSNKFTTQLMTTFGIMIVNNSRRGLANSDIVISLNLGRYNLLKIERKDDIIREGYNATIRAMPEIIKLLSGDYKIKPLVD